MICADVPKSTLAFQTLLDTVRHPAYTACF
jgi:hypothetical protein